MGKGLYGQNQGNENRNQTAVLEERYLDNGVIEGDIVKVLVRMFQEKDWKAFNGYIADLGKEGFSRSRIDSMVARATMGRF